MDLKLLEIAISLIFIYLLLSIFAMVIMEIISTLWRMRGELLKDSIKKLLFTMDKNSSGIENFYQQPIIKFLGDNATSWIWLDKLFNLDQKKMPSYMKAEDFYDNLLSYLNKNQFSDDLKNIEDTIGKNQFLSDDAKKHLQFLIHKSNGEITLFKASIERWFNETMERANSWYSRQVQYFLLLIGFVLAVFVNGDTIAIFKKLDQDPKLRSEIVQRAEQYVRDNKTVPPGGVSAENMNEINEKVHSEYIKLMSESQDILNWKVNEFEDLNNLEKVLKILGFLITATAISLGSNFWFDMLKKVINIRTLGKPTQPTQK
ncbi:hypothetical protein [Chryseobacterium caseinilyticum]|uniref:Uncharacterized protein n=1 Tax=Chryseobacterium caseinilyticum TaxID=2771428 RepID=A0ABR8Z6B5_9FLAO|nr:hypothetical protein [Chryseobacterium caseinilyticum]MBD8080828.1 hypothetical protein [Chryseobacterium caseinilyticum]